MPQVPIFDQKHEEVGTVDLTDDLFNVDVRPEILHMVVRAHLAAQRSGTVGVKTRGLVRGGGKKPWRQKGTGRARAGTIRSPLWRGGAVVHGPVSRDYSFKVNKKIRKQAMKMALTSRFRDEALMVVDDLRVDAPKTKLFAEIQNSLGLKNALIVLPEQYKDLELSARNLKGVCLATADSINVYEIISRPQLVLHKDVLGILKERLQ